MTKPEDLHAFYITYTKPCSQTDRHAHMPQSGTNLYSENKS